MHIQPKARGDIRTVAERTFERLGMTKTALRNGVMLFIACEENNASRSSATSGIDEKVPAGFWDEIAAKLTIRFKAGEFTDGIVEAIHSAGEAAPPRTSRAPRAMSTSSPNEINVEH